MERARSSKELSRTGARFHLEGFAQSNAVGQPIADAVIVLDIEPERSNGSPYLADGRFKRGIGACFAGPELIPQRIEGDKAGSGAC